MRTRDAPSGGPSWRHIAVLAAALLLAAAMFGVGVLVPYSGDDLQRLPLGEVASGAHDAESWPQELLVHVSALFRPLLLPFAAAAGALFGALGLALVWRRPRSQPVLKTLALLMIVAASTAALLFPLSDLGRAVTVWRLDEGPMPAVTTGAR